MRPINQLPAPLLPPEPGGHLPVALLRQYVAGTLAPAAQHHVEAHTLDCQRCADVLEGLGMTTAATTDQSLADLQSRLRVRAAQKTAPKPAAATWPWLQMAGALLLLLASIVGWRLNQAKTEAQSEQVAAVMRPEEIAPPQPEAAPPASPKPKVKAPKSRPTPAEEAATAASAAAVPRPAPVASATAKAVSRPRPQAAKPADIDVAARKTATPTKDKVVADSVSPSKLTAVAAAPMTAAAPAPLPPDQTRTSLARIATPAAPATPDSNEQAAKLPPNGDPRSLINSNALTSSMRLVRGRITEHSGAGLSGATVLIKGTNQGVSTQADGSFALPIPDSQLTLTISSIGYQTREYQLTNPSAPLTLALTTDTKSLSEVVVTRKGQMPAPPAVGPAPTGGLPAFHEYLKKELVYPEKALQDRTEGTVKLRFTVATTGAIEDLKVVSGLSKECNEEAMRLVREGPAWFPGISEGRRTAQQVRIAVPFQLP